MAENLTDALEALRAAVRDAERYLAERDGKAPAEKPSTAEAFAAHIAGQFGGDSGASARALIGEDGAE